MDEFLVDLVEILEDNEQDLKRMLLGFNNLQQNNGNESAFFDPELIKFISSPMAESPQKKPPRHRQVDGKLLVHQLLAIANDILYGQKEKCFVTLLEAIERLLDSGDLQKIRSAFFLICKMQFVCETEIEIRLILLDALQCSGKQFSAFIEILECLENQQNDLAVTTISSHLPLLNLMSSDLSKRWMVWLRSLCVRILQDERIPVLREALHYFLKHLSFKRLRHFKLLPEFVMATNRNELFDYEDPNSLTEEQVKQFVSDAYDEFLLDALVTVPWKSIPLLHWMRSLEPEQIPIISKDLLLKLFSIIRTLENCYLRQKANEEAIRLFDATLNNFALGDYMNSIETLFIKGDVCSEHERLEKKIEECTDFEAQIDHLNKNCYDIFNDSIKISSGWPLSTFVRKAQTIPKHKHGWWRLHLNINQRDYYHTIYNVDFDLILGDSSLEKKQLHLITKLDCETSEERSFVMARCVDLLMLQIRSWNQLKELNLKPLELLQQGTHETCHSILKLLAFKKKRLNDDVLTALIDNLRCSDEAAAILSHTHTLKLTEDEGDTCVAYMLEKKCFDARFSVYGIGPKISKSFALKKLLDGEPTTGDARIEAAYGLRMFNFAHYDTWCRTWVISLFAYSQISNKSNREDLSNDLLALNNKLSIKDPCYLENSWVHRQKIRIIVALTYLMNCCWSDKLWDALLCPNDQLGITIMYEFLVSLLLQSPNQLLDKLKTLPTLQPTQQESLLIVTHNFVKLNMGLFIEVGKLENIFTLLIPLTKEASKQTRLLAQLVLHCLATKCKDAYGLEMEVAAQQKKLIEVELGEKLQDLSHEFRLIFWETFRFLGITALELILSFTNAPYDEYPGQLNHIISTQHEVIRKSHIISSSTSKNLFLKRMAYQI